MNSQIHTLANSTLWTGSLDRRWVSTTTSLNTTEIWDSLKCSYLRSINVKLGLCADSHPRIIWSYTSQYVHSDVSIVENIYLKNVTLVYKYRPQCYISSYFRNMKGVYNKYHFHYQCYTIQELCTWLHSTLFSGYIFCHQYIHHSKAFQVILYKHFILHCSPL